MTDNNGFSDRKCPKCSRVGKPVFMKVQEWGNPDYKWNCLNDGCNYSVVSPWVGVGKPSGLEGRDQ